MLFVCAAGWQAFFFTRAVKAPCLTDSGDRENEASALASSSADITLAQCRPATDAQLHPRSPILNPAPGPHSNHI